jgi:hypothetical protein
MKFGPRGLEGRALLQLQSMTLPPQSRILRQTLNWTQHLVVQPAMSAEGSSARETHTLLQDRKSSAHTRTL